MNKRLAAFVVWSGICLTGCGLSEDTPPKAVVQAGDETYEMAVGSYCWEDTCADVAGSMEELTEGTKTVKASPGETLVLAVKHEPEPNEVHVVQTKDNQETEVAVKDNQMSAPMEKGLYYYSCGAWWMDEEEPNLSHGDAFYSFALEVE